MAPQIIYLSLAFAGMLLQAHLHGKEKKGKNNFFSSFIAWLISTAILYWGGFFDVFFK